MLNDNKQIKNITLAKGHEEPRSLFVIPNPYDDFLRAKKGCSSEIQKQEMQLKNLAMHLQQPGSQQATVQQELQLIKTYFANLLSPIKKK